MFNIKIRNYYQERPSAFDFKDATTQGFDSSDTFFNVSIKSCFFHLIAISSNS